MMMEWSMHCTTKSKTELSQISQVGWDCSAQRITTQSHVGGLQQITHR